MYLYVRKCTSTFNSPYVMYCFYIYIYINIPWEVQGLQNVEIFCTRNEYIQASNHEQTGDPQ